MSKSLLFILSITTFFVESALAQGAPDLYVRDNLAFGRFRHSCQMLASKSAPYSFAFREYDATAGVQRFQFISPGGGVVTKDAPGMEFSEYGARFAMSSDGRNIAIVDHSASANEPGLWFSSDFGSTFLRLPFVSTPPYTQSSSPGLPFNFYQSSTAHFTFGPDNKLYVFYYSFNPGGTTLLDTVRLELMVVDQNGGVSHTPISPVVGSASFFPAFASLAVTSTQTKIVATAWPGKPYYRRGATTFDPLQAMLVVYDIATQTFDTLSYGKPGITSFNAFEYLGASIFVPDNIKSDGTNVFMITGLPWNNFIPNGLIREYVANAPGNTLTFFRNTETLDPGYQPTWQPFMDISHPSLTSTGITVSSLGDPQTFVSLYGIGAPWNTNGGSSHTLDIVYRTWQQEPPAVLYPGTYQRMRVVQPNNGVGSAAPERLEDLSSAVVSPFGIVSHIPLSYGSAPTTVPLVGGVAHVFCQELIIPPVLLPFNVSLFIFDLS